MFANPFLLLGLGGIAVPIIIHLLNRRQFQHVVWAAMRFLQISMEQNRRRLRIEDLLLLLLRCLIMALLALTLARPLWRYSHLVALGSSKVTAVVILDNSASMGQTDGTESRFVQAKRIADNLLDGFPRGSAAALLLAADTVDPVIAEPSLELGRARELVHQAALTGRATDLLPALQKASAILRDKPNPHKEIYVITDGQALGWKLSADIQRLLEAQKEDITTNVIFVGTPEPTNLGVSDLRLTADLAIVNQPLRFEVQVTNYGHTEVRSVPVRLALDNQPASEETTIEAIPAGESRSVSLFARCRTDGFHSVSARIPPDRLPSDDVRSIVIHCLKKVDLLLVDGHPGEALRDRESYLLQEALQPVDPQQRANFYIQVKTIGPAELENIRLDLFDAVLLADVPDFSPKALAQFVAYLRQGNGLVFFPGNLTNIAFYNDELYRRRGILPAGLGPARGAADQAEKYTTFKPGNLEHPLVARWNDSGAGRLEAAHFFRWFDLDITPRPTAASRPGAVAAVGSTEPGTPQVVLRYQDGTAAMVEHTWGAGRVILFSSTASTRWNDLAAHPQVFIPLLHRAIGAILQRNDDFQNLKAGQKCVLHPPLDMLGRDATITPPAHEPPLPPAICRVVLQDDKPTLVYEATDLPGIYTVSFGADAPALQFAVQQDPLESQLDTLPPPQREILERLAHVVTWQPGTPVTLTAAGVVGSSEIWKYPAIMLLLLAVAEVLLAHWFSQPK